MNYIRVLRHEGEEGRRNYDIEVNFRICAKGLSKADAWDWLDELTDNWDCQCENYEISFSWA